MFKLFQLTAPGGRLLFRDYGLYDHTMFRLKPKQCCGYGGKSFYRQEGTLTYFFDIGECRGDTYKETLASSLT